MKEKCYNETITQDKISNIREEGKGYKKMKRKVLIVEDNDLNRELLAGMLKVDYEILEACDGVEALELMEKEYKNLSAVVLDLLMPRMSGIEVLMKMREHTGMRQLPVIVATGENNERVEEEALMAGANDYILKPYNMNILRNRLWNVIDLREQAAIVNAAKTDALTGLYSRDTFFEKAGVMVEAQEPGFFIMACFDVEHFKIINDQYGSARGDVVLKYIAQTFQEGFRQAGGICSRIMADNFAVLYPKSFAESEEICEIRRKAAALDGLILPITFSIGRYVAEDVTLSPSAMYDRAVLAKESVKGRYDRHIAVYDESMRNRILNEQEIISEMKSALEEHQFENWYQPQFNHVTGALVGAEALVRWRHPVKGLISPGVFIPIFEKNGFVYEVDKYVWEQSCIFLKEMQDSGRRIVPISVNISRYDIFREDLVAFISGLVQKYQIPTEALRLEITESAFAQSGDQIIRVVKEFKALGFTMEIDDFGSGYSSLNTLKDVPADVLKLDMRFLEGEENSDKGGNIVESIVRMAKWIGMSVIAEGVEEIEQADFLKSIGCYYIQGYFYSKPLPKQEYEQIMAEKNCEEKMATLEKVDTYDNEAFWDPKSMETIIFNSFVGGASVFEYCDGKVEIIRVNDKYSGVLGGGQISAWEASQMKWTDYMTPQGKAEAYKAILEAIRTQGEVSHEMELQGLRSPEKSVYIKANMRVIARAGNRYLFYAVLEDMTLQKEAELHERTLAAQMQMILDNVGNGITATIVKEDSVKYLFANDQYFRMLGYTREQYQTEVSDTYAVIVPEDRERMRQAAQQINYSDKPVIVDYRAICRDGAIKWIRLSGVGAMTPEANQPVQLSVFYDITDKINEEEQTRKKYERELRLRKELIRNSILYFQLNVTTETIEEYYTKLNDQPFIKRDIVLNREIERQLLEKIKPEDREQISGRTFCDILRKAYACGETSLQFIYHRWMPEREYHWVKMDVSIMEKPDNGNVVAFLQCRDIDVERKSRLSIERILDEDIESVLWVDVNSGVANIAHMRKDINYLELRASFDFQEAYRKYSEDVVSEESQEKFKRFFHIESLKKLLEENPSAMLHYQVTENGQLRRKASKAYYLDDMKDAIVLTRRDITESYVDEQHQKHQLREAVEKANAANHAKSDFLSHMSHDIRTPLNAVLAFSNRELTDTADEPKLREYLDKVNVSGEYLLGIVNDVLDMSKIEQNKIILHPEPYALREFEKTVRNVIDELSSERNIEFVMDASQNITPEIMVDHVRFNQIFINLLSNAVKFTPRGGKVELIIEEYPQSEGNGIVKRLIVRDNGIGMSEEFIPHAYESFHQEQRKEASERDKGTGLGLAIVKELVQLMGGTIQLESQLHKGTTFTVDIPFEKSEMLEQKKEDCAKDYSKLRGVHILLAEDNSINREIAVTLLEKHGCVIDCSINGEDVCEKFRTSPLGYYQMILMDIRMPVMDGLTATKKIRDMEREDAKTIPIIAMTADAFNEDEKIAVEAGMNMHMAKPFDPRILYDICSQYVS